MASRGVDVQVQVEGLRDLKRALRNVEPDIRKEFREESFKKVAVIVAGRAKVLAPKRTGRLAASIRGTTSGFSARVRSPLPYAAVHQWGGSIRPRGGRIVIRRSEYVTRAVEQKSQEIENALVDGIHEVARRNGWA